MRKPITFCRDAVLKYYDKTVLCMQYCGIGQRGTKRCGFVGLYLYCECVFYDVGTGTNVVLKKNGESQYKRVPSEER